MSCEEFHKVFKVNRDRYKINFTPKLQPLQAEWKYKQEADKQNKQKKKKVCLPLILLKCAYICVDLVHSLGVKEAETATQQQTAKLRKSLVYFSSKCFQPSAGSSSLFLCYSLFLLCSFCCEFHILHQTEFI